MKSFLLVIIGISVCAFADVTKNGDIVIDIGTGLQWQDDADAKNITKTWTEAIDYCENLTLGGFSDWRLPNINELKTIVDKSKYNHNIVTEVTNLSTVFYWSSTSVAGNSNAASWLIAMGNGKGGVGHGYKGVETYHVRCVRAELQR